jgi:predicted transcriptional regulator
MTEYFEQEQDTGQIKQQYSDQDFVDAVGDHDPASTTEVAESVGCTQRNALERLRKLEDAGRIQSKDVGRSFIWFRE